MQSPMEINRKLRRTIKPGSDLMTGFAILVFTFFLCACGKPFNVQPKPKVMPATYNVSGASNGVTVDAEAVTDEDKLYDTFEANLILAGVLPVRVRLTNSQSETVDLKTARFTIRAQNQTFKSIDAKSAYKRLMNYYSISVYNKAGYKESRDDFSAYEFNIKNRLAANEPREGLMFFAIPDDVVKTGDLMLVVTKLNSAKTKDNAPLELRLK
jgi:hypothetical protein